MNALVRCGKFNLVGAMGMVLQLAVLALLNRLLAGHYLCASAMAVELALLHNFAWHWNYTWRDRREGIKSLRPFVRFHLSNGFVSILGNLVLMRLLMHHEHLPLLLANGIAIICCSIANFFVGDHWVFARARNTYPPASTVTGTASVPCRVITLYLLFLGCTCAHAQANSQASSSVGQADQLPNAPQVQPTPNTTYHIDPSASYLYHVGAFCGTGASTSRAGTTLRRDAELG